MRPKKTLAEVLASVSEILFPHLMGEGHVGVGSRSSCGDTPLHVVARWGSVEEVALLIAGGADVNAVGEMGETPLHVALSD
jgi:ankyrin repeat protein